MIFRFFLSHRLTIFLWPGPPVKLSSTFCSWPVFIGTFTHLWTCSLVWRVCRGDVLWGFFWLKIYWFWAISTPPPESGWLVFEGEWLVFWKFKITPIPPGSWLAMVLSGHCFVMKRKTSPQISTQKKGIHVDLIAIRGTQLLLHCTVYANSHLLWCFLWWDFHALDDIEKWGPLNYKDFSLHTGGLWRQGVASVSTL